MQDLGICLENLTTWNRILALSYAVRVCYEQQDSPSKITIREE